MQHMYCLLKAEESEPKKRYSKFFTNKLAYSVVTNRLDCIIEVDIEECPGDTGDFYAWKFNSTGAIDFIFPSRNMLETCFPYGTANDNSGKVITVKVNEVK